MNRTSRTRRPLRRLTGQDAWYIRAETASEPLHFVLLGFVAPAADGTPLTLDAARGHVAERLHLLPALRRKVRRTPFDKGPMVWVDDESFDLARHVRAWPDGPVDADDLDRALAAAAERPVDLSRPLWEVTVGKPLPDGRTPLALIVHHAMMDGGLLVAVLESLFGAAADEAPPDWEPALPPSGARLLAIGISERLRDRLRPSPRRAWSPSSTTAPLAGRVGPRRATATTILRLADLRRVRHATGATINDVFLTALGEGLTRMLGERGVSAPDEGLLLMVPRDVRGEEERHATGNRTRSMFIRLPVDRCPVEERLRTISERTTEAKAAGPTGGARPRFDLSASNVRLGAGHAVAGRPITSYLIAGPLQGETRIVAVGMSYADEFVVTFTADADAFPDLEALAASTREGFLRLLRATCAQEAS